MANSISNGKDIEQNAELAIHKMDHQQRDQLHDYVIKVEDSEFRVNKAVLASQSAFFRAMFNGGWADSNTDEIELNGQRAEVIKEILDFISTGQEDIFHVAPSEILECAVYLQMPTVIQFCVQKLVSQLGPDNCLEMFSMFVFYNLENAVEDVKNYVQLIWESGNFREWDAFRVVRAWAHPYFYNKTKHINDLMSDIRFALMSKEELKAVQQSVVYGDYEGTWHDLVTAAVEYTNLPVHLRVINQTEQSTVRKAARPMFFTTGEYEDASTVFSLYTDSQWVTHEKEALNTPTFTEWRPMGVAVNNFFVICNGYESNQEWHIFDPRTLAWSQIASIARPKIEFELVHHKGHIYVLGGTYIDHSETEDGEMEETHETDRYSFLANEWTSICRLPYMIINPAACVIGDIVYVCDGMTLYCFDFSSDDQRWEEKASCLTSELCQPMHVMTLNGEQVIVIIHLSTSTSVCGDEIHIYSPALNQWSFLDHPFTKHFKKVIRSDDAMTISDGNSVYLLALHGYLGDLDDTKAKVDNDSWTVDVCVKWVIPEMGNEMEEVILDDFPISDVGMWAPAVHTFGALLAIPPHYVTMYD